MRHDPLCEANEYGETYDCDCRKIAAVREDERKSDASGILYLNQTQMNDVLAEMRRVGYAAALRDALACFDQDDAYAAIEALQ